MEKLSVFICSERARRHTHREGRKSERKRERESKKERERGGERSLGCHQALSLQLIPEWLIVCSTSLSLYIDNYSHTRTHTNTHTQTHTHLAIHNKMKSNVSSSNVGVAGGPQVP